MVLMREAGCDLPAKEVLELFLIGAGRRAQSKMFLSLAFNPSFHPPVYHQLANCLTVLCKTYVVIHEKRGFPVGISR
jgi:hypothetical protein